MVKAGWRGYGNSLCCFCSPSINLKLFHNKKFVNNILGKIKNYTITLPAEVIKGINFPGFLCVLSAPIYTNTIFLSLLFPCTLLFSFKMYPRNFPCKYIDFPYFLFTCISYLIVRCWNFFLDPLLSKCVEDRIKLKSRTLKTDSPKSQ